MKTLITNANKIGVIELEGAIASSYESSLFSKEALSSCKPVTYISPVSLFKASA